LQGLDFEPGLDSGFVLAFGFSPEKDSASGEASEAQSFSGTCNQEAFLAS